MTKRSIVALLAALLLAGASLSARQAQTATGQVIGVVRDPSGSPLPGATVTLSGPATSQLLTAVTSVNGEFQIARVPPGTYVMNVRMAGFFPFTQSDIVVRADVRTQLLPTLACCPPGPAGLVDRAEPATVRVRITTSLGNIDVEIDMAHAPVTATNFLKYVDAGLYNGGRFYRVTREGNYTPTPPNRPLMEIIQGGIDPSRRSEAFKAIPLERTTVTGLKHVTGVISMARGNSADTATSEFFILLNDQPSLDMGGKRFDDEQGAAAFGKVVTGLDVVRKINQEPINPQSPQQLATPMVIQSIARVK